MSDQVAFRPHARLLTMLGEQLIKSDQIGLVEIVKNSYDADATEVSVDFRRFGPSFEVMPDSAIVITDNGCGMTYETLRTAWMSPATPTKLRRKGRDARTPGGRILQGEKGIGRFAVFKLGAKIDLVTRAESSDEEGTLSLDISEIDAGPPGATSEDAAAAEIAEVYLSDVKATLDRRSPQIFVEEPPGAHGTQLEIGMIRSGWSDGKARGAFADLERLRPVMWSSNDIAPSGKPFKVTFYKDGADLHYHEEEGGAHLQAALDRAVLTVTEGRVDVAERVVSLKLNGQILELPIDGAEFRGLRPFRERFLKEDPDVVPNLTCGPFGFEFYIFDFSNLAPAEYTLDKADRELLRQHRVYLYRDGVRVYPYGDPDDDWLQIDVIRGTQSARSMFSNDQTVGFVSITQADNPMLRDKTNREGLIEHGAATGDFITLIQCVLAYLRTKPYERYAQANRRARDQKRPPRDTVDNSFEELKAGALSEEALKVVQRLESAIGSEREVSQMQIARTQELAGVGLSVESASHDLIAASGEALRVARLIVEELRQLGLAKEYVYTLATSLVQRLAFVDSRFQDVQGLFVSTRQKRGLVDVMQQARKVRSMYGAMHKAKGIAFELDDSTRLRVTTTEAAVLQALINLVDNATYWLITEPRPARAIRIFASAPDTLAISDNGPGVAPADEPFIFEAFYSGKGDAGKGLGLYIVHEVAARNGFAVNLETPDDPRSLPGATFTLRFAEVRD